MTGVGSVGRQRIMTSLLQNENPYAVTTEIDSRQDVWRVGDVEFSVNELRVTGDLQLPPICIQTGSDRDLVPCSRVLRPISLATVAMCVPIFLTTILIPVVGSRILRGWEQLVIWMPCVVVSLLSHWMLSHRLKVTWCVSQECILRCSRRRRWGLSAVALLAVIVAVVSLLFPMVTSLGVEIVLYAAIVAYLLTMPPSLRPMGDKKGRFILRGFNESFVQAWLKKLGKGGVPTHESLRGRDGAIAVHSKKRKTNRDVQSVASLLRK